MGRQGSDASEVGISSLFGAIGMLLWGGAAALEMYGVVAVGENASPIGKAPTITAAAIGSLILLGVPYQAVAQTPPKSRVRRIPGFAGSCSSGAR
jgi:hypothetical protein